MSPTRALVLSLVVGFAAVAGVFALTSTLSLGSHARAANDKHIAARTAQLNRYEANLRKALAQKLPPLPPFPSASSGSTTLSSAVAAPVRVVYHRPPPTVVVTHHAGGEHDRAEGGADD